MFDNDICLCGGQGIECPFRKECLRGQNKIGIYTIADFYAENDTKEEKCKYFIPIKE